MTRRPFIVVAIALLVLAWLGRPPNNSPSLASSKSHMFNGVNCRFKGAIVKIFRSGKNLSMVVSGEVAVKGLDETQADVYLTIVGWGVGAVRGADKPTEYRVGSTVIGIGQIRPPLPPPFHGAFSELGMAKAIGTDFVVKSFARDVSLVADPDVASVIRRYLTGAIHSVLKRCTDSAAYPIVVALLLGDKSLLSNEQKKAYSISGTAHIFSVSGAHVGIIAGMLLLMLGGAPRSWTIVAVFCTSIWLYVWLCGMPAASIRAAGMSTIAIVGIKLERKVDLLNILAAVVCVLIPLDLERVHSAGFVMSVSAVASILVLSPRWTKLFKRCTFSTSKKWKLLQDILAVNIAASVGTVVPIAWYFGTVSLVGPLANLIVVPLLSLALPLIVLCLLLNPFWTFGAEALGETVSVLVWLADFVSHAAASINPELQMSGAQVVCVAFVAAGTWLLVSKTWAQLYVRLGMVFVLGIWGVWLCSTKPVSMQSGYIPGGIAVQVRVHEKRVTLYIEERKGLTNVRVDNASP